MKQNRRVNKADILPIDKLILQIIILIAAAVIIAKLSLGIVIFMVIFYLLKNAKRIN